MSERSASSRPSTARVRRGLIGAAACSALALGAVLAGPGTAAASTEPARSLTPASTQAVCPVHWKTGVDYAGRTAGYSWAWNVLVSQGATGDRVREIQCLVNYQIGYGLTVDGNFGPATRAGVEKLQRDRRLTPVDGIVGPDTWRQLRR
ncbi:peptidoglycan-binding domain-containing protein [Streptomyces griseus]|uniref:peptidoglycan-binding domain-containing protein n=1 Tax=Streptomyces griseus TaxID=1911 RepID=UPI0033B94502